MPKTDRSASMGPDVERDERLRIVYVGASQHEDVDEPLVDFCRRHPSDISAYDADPGAGELLVRRFGTDVTFHPECVGDGSPVRLHVMRQRGQSAVFPRGGLVTRLFENFAEQMECERLEERRTVRLDANESGLVDLLKIDVQGAQNQVIDGASGLMAQVAVVEVECEFVAQYEGAPLFADTAKLLDAAGFQFHCFTGYASRPVRGFGRVDDPYGPGSQWLWAECVFVRRFEAWGGMSARALRGAAAVLLDLYDSADLAALALSLRAARLHGAGPALWERTRARLLEMGRAIDVDAVREVAVLVGDPHG